MDSIRLHIDGDNRHLSPDVVFSQVAKALRSMSLKSGDHDIILDRSGAIWLNGMKVFEPSRPLIAKRGA